MSRSSRFLCCPAGRNNLFPYQRYTDRWEVNIKNERCILNIDCNKDILTTVFGLSECGTKPISSQLLSISNPIYVRSSEAGEVLRLHGRRYSGSARADKAVYASRVNDNAHAADAFSKNISITHDPWTDASAFVTEKPGNGPAYH